jgi:pyroglutamyl-peptidase
VTTVLLTGFEPFAGDATNPSGEAVRLVASRWDGPELLVTDVLPVTFAGAARRLSELIAEHSPDIVLSTGLAGARAEISVERVAVNLVDARIPDNDGAQPIDIPSVAGAPAAHFATLPVKEITRRIVDAGIPAAVSHSAGTFVCNHVFFTASEVAASGTRVGFLHVPWAEGHASSADAATLPLGDIVRAIELAVRTSIDVSDDARVTGGALY